MNKIDLEGQHAVVTGGAQGLGFAMAKRIVASGAAVTLWDMDGALLEKAKAALGAAARTVAVDITDAEAVVKAHAASEAASGSGVDPGEFGGNRRPDRFARRI